MPILRSSRVMTAGNPARACDLATAGGGFTRNCNERAVSALVYSLLMERPQARMLDREKVVAVLKHRFPGAAAGQVAAATNAIVGLDDEWVELPSQFSNGNSHRPAPCESSCYLAEAARQGGSFRVFKRVDRNDQS